jgi:hypothetical protein
MSEFRTLLTELDPPTVPWDPIQRTTFIEEFPAWCGDLANLTGILSECDSADLQSGLSLALGSVSPPEDIETKTSIADTVSRWAFESPDSGTHSAARWALRQWSVELPQVTVTTDPPTTASGGTCQMVCD